MSYDADFRLYPSVLLSYAWEIIHIRDHPTKGTQVDHRRALQIRPTSRLHGYGLGCTRNACLVCHERVVDSRVWRSVQPVWKGPHRRVPTAVGYLRLCLDHSYSDGG